MKTLLLWTISLIVGFIGVLTVLAWIGPDTVRTTIWNHDALTRFDPARDR